MTPAELAEALDALTAAGDDSVLLVAALDKLGEGGPALAPHLPRLAAYLDHSGFYHVPERELPSLDWATPLEDLWIPAHDLYVRDAAVLPLLAGDVGELPYLTRICVRVSAPWTPAPSASGSG